MQIDHVADKAMIAATAQQVRRPWLQLIAAVLELAGPRAELLSHAERPWASITFTGSRHSLSIAFTGSAAVDAGELFIAALPEHEFAMPGQIVADASVTGVEHELMLEPRLVVALELLLLEER